MTRPEKENLKKYDFIVSLGGNCAAQGQCRQRGLQTYSMPFDNFFLRNENDIEKFIKAFEGDFQGCFLKENLKELAPEERGNSVNPQYYDTVSGYNIIHLFDNPIDTQGEYEKAIATINRRLKRFYEFCDIADNILFFLTTEYDIKNELAKKILAALKKRFPNKKVSLLVVMFSANEDSIQNIDDIELHRIARPANEYNYYRSNIEWLFLENYRVKKPVIKAKKYIFKICFIKRGIIIHLFNCMSTVFRINLYLFGLKLDLCIGKMREIVSDKVVFYKSDKYFVFED